MYFDLLQIPPILREFVFQMGRLQSLGRRLDNAEARIYLGKLFLADKDNFLADFVCVVSFANSGNRYFPVLWHVALAAMV